jgi:hypothetical protein
MPICVCHWFIGFQKQDNIVDIFNSTSIHSELERVKHMIATGNGTEDERCAGNTHATCTGAAGAEMLSTATDASGGVQATGGTAGGTAQPSSNLSTTKVAETSSLAEVGCVFAWEGELPNHPSSVLQWAFGCQAGVHDRAHSVCGCV